MQIVNMDNKFKSEVLYISIDNLDVLDWNLISPKMNNKANLLDYIGNSLIKQ